MDDGYKTDGRKEQQVELRSSRRSKKAKASESVDAVGGWHNSSDDIKFGATSATAIFQMLFAYKMNYLAFDDVYDASGKKESNGIPDVLDEVKWGLDWLVKMNPKNQVIYHQVGDDREMGSFGLEAGGYGEGKTNKQRPVYLATGLPQGVIEHTNRSSGVSSIAGKYASAFALGANVLKKYYPSFADSLEEKAFELYDYGKEYPGVCQSVPARLPYFYEEDNWADDMELAAAQLYYASFDSKYMKDAIDYGRMEPVSPWFYADTAKHYQWYPFINYGHFLLANTENPVVRKEFLQNILSNLQRAALKKDENPFGVTTPMIWNSNNYVVALATQCYLYRRFTDDSTFVDMENNLVDWLFGCNPWGVSMIAGLPKAGVSPQNLYIASSQNSEEALSGALVAGPVRETFSRKLVNGSLSKPDAYQKFQTNWAVYHDDKSDFLTNQPTIDGTASLLYLLSAKQFDGYERKQKDNNEYNRGAIVRTDHRKKRISLVFSGHEFTDGQEDIMRALDKLDIKASFFLTGDFLRNSQNKKLIKKIYEKGHYIGPHSDKYLFYCQPKDPNLLFVQKSVFLDDLAENYQKLEKFGVKKTDAPFFLPPYECNPDSISLWCKEIGVTLINHTPGTFSDADTSTPEMRQNYYSGIEIYNSIIAAEKDGGLNGYILLFHLGSDPLRTDKFHTRLYALLSDLKKKGYEFVDLYQATNLFSNDVDNEHKKRKNQ